MGPGMFGTMAGTMVGTMVGAMAGAMASVSGRYNGQGKHKILFLNTSSSIAPATGSNALQNRRGGLKRASKPSPELAARRLWGYTAKRRVRPPQKRYISHLWAERPGNAF